jgi:mycothiol system anti-sigma-R factor
MQSCEQVIQNIWEYLDKEMCSADMSEVQKHLDLCRGCFTRMEFEKLLREKMQKATNHCCPEKLKQRIKKLIDLY